MLCERGRGDDLAGTIVARLPMQTVSVGLPRAVGWTVHQALNQSHGQLNMI